LLDSIKDRETALGGLRASLAALDQQEALTQLDTATLEARLRATLADFSALRSQHPARARSLLMKVISGRITFTPVVSPDRRYYKLEWLGYFGGLLSEEVTALSPRAHADNSFFGGGPKGIRTRVSVATTFSPLYPTSWKVIEP
jgi:hypothetical protein